MSKKSKLINLLIIILSVVLLLLYIMMVDGLDNIINVFASCNPYWLIVGVLIMIGYWYLEGHVLNYGVGIFGPKLKAKYSAKNCMIGQFFNNITPAATGGQPMQAYYMNKCGVGYGLATSALLLRFIAFQFSLTILCTIVIIFKYEEFAAKVQSFSVLMLIGFTINTVIAFMLILIGINKKVSAIIMHFFVRLFGKIKLVKDVNKKLEFVDNEVELFNKSFATALKHKKKILVMLILTTLQLLLFYSINIAIAFCFGVNLNYVSSLNIIAGAACVQMSSSFVPLPGAAGGAELSYYILYGGIFQDSYLSAAVLLWRMYTFYMPTIIGLYFSRDLFGSKILKNEKEA